MNPKKVYKSFIDGQKKARKAVKGQKPIDINGIQQDDTTYTMQNAVGNSLYIDPNDFTVKPPVNDSIWQTTSHTSTWPNMDAWSKEQKDALAKVGFRYDKKKNEWYLDLTATVKISDMNTLMSGIYGGKDDPQEAALEAIKELRKQINEKLTAKAILTELTRPKEVKDDGPSMVGMATTP